MILAHKIAFDPNNVQETYFRQAAETARFAYNWALDQWHQPYDAGKADPTWPKPTEAALRRQLNAIKRQEFPWMLEVTKNAPQMAIMHLGQAFQNFFAGIAEYPTFNHTVPHKNTPSKDAQAMLMSSELPQFTRLTLRTLCRSLARDVCAKMSGMSGSRSTIGRYLDPWIGCLGE